MANNNLPLVSVVIVNYNGKDFVHNCIESILKNNYNNYEVIVVDNGSKDGSVRFLKDKYSNSLKPVKIVELEKNFGPAKARNEGVKIARGEYVGFLDNDTEVDPEWITEAVKLFEKDNKIGCLQCKLMLLRDKERFDYGGDYVNQYGFLIQRVGFREIDKGQYDKEIEILSAKSAGMFIRRDIFEKVSGFDEDYFIFVEETDLAWRYWLSGYKTVFCPRSIVYHEFSTSVKILSKEKNNYNVRFHGTKNYIMTLIKNLGVKHLLATLPIHVSIWVGLMIVLAFRGHLRSAFNILKGILWNIVALNKTIRKRRKIQSERILSDDLLLALIMKKQSLLVKIKQFFLAEKLVETTEK